MKETQHIQLKIKRLEHWQMIAILLMICDFLAIHLSYFLALWIRFDCVFSEIPKGYLNAYRSFITVFSIVSIVIFWFFRMYRSVWRYTSYSELIRTLAGSVTSSILHIILITLICTRMPLSYYFFGAMVQGILLVAPRFSYRLLLLVRAKLKPVDETAGRVMIIDAGQAG